MNVKQRIEGARDMAQETLRRISTKEQSDRQAVLQLTSHQARIEALEQVLAWMEEEGK